MPKTLICSIALSIGLIFVCTAFADDHSIKSLTPDPQFSFEDKGATIKLAGTWLGMLHALNVVTLNADQKRNIIT